MADILIVEDETAINELIRRNLELVGHRCVSVYDGEEAIRRLQEGQFDLMLLDIDAAGGRTALRCIRPRSMYLRFFSRQRAGFPTE